MAKWLQNVIAILVFIVGMALIAGNQRNVGPTGLFLMILGLACILALLFIYNKQHQ